MKKCPFLKGEYKDISNNNRYEFQSCDNDCMAYDGENDSCKLIERKKFQFIN